ncbi:MAG: APC family permease [Saprospiraceae bacterium]|nr:APC family permease [Saprospiraceae bacterium]
MSYRACTSEGGTSALKKGGTLGLGSPTFLSSSSISLLLLVILNWPVPYPKAGGGFDYATRALGKDWGFIAGMA